MQQSQVQNSWVFLGIRISITSNISPYSFALYSLPQTTDVASDSTVALLLEFPGDDSHGLWSSLSALLGLVSCYGDSALMGCLSDCAFLLPNRILLRTHTAICL